MKYESSILKRLVDTYGVVGNPQYISEVIKEFIVRGKESFPNLFTYQSDWLAHINEFGLNPSYTVSYTGQSIYAPNTLERPVKSAILKGSTKYRDIDTGEILEAFEEGRNLELVSVKMPVLKTYNKYTAIDIEFISKTGNIEWSKTERNITIIAKERWKYITFNIPHQSGISYNLKFDYNAQKYFKLITDNIITSATNPSIPEGTGSFSIDFTSTEKEVLTFAIPEISTVKLMNIEISLIESKDEPYKSNILSTSEDVELRGIGDVQDTLDCLTGEKVERVGEVVLDGSEGWSVYIANEDTISFIGARVENAINKQYDSTNLMSDKLVASGYGAWSKVNNITLNTKSFSICVLKSSLETLDVNGFKKWLSENPIKVQYILETPAIKTVVLTIKDHNNQSVDHLKSFNGGTHVYTSSLEGSLVPSVDISVVTDLEETMKMCTLDGNTL